MAFSLLCQLFWMGLPGAEDSGPAITTSK